MSVIPPATPGLWKKVPGFLADPLGPLAIRWSYLPKVLPWLARYLASGWTEARVARTAVALRAMLRDAPALHAALAEEAGVGQLIERRGLMYVYPSRAEFAAEAMAWRIRRQVGIEWLELSAEELRQREPGLDRRYGFAALVEEGGHCRDPGAYVAALVALAEAQGAKRVAARATGFRIEAGRLRAVRTERRRDRRRPRGDQRRRAFEGAGRRRRRPPAAGIRARLPRHDRGSRGRAAHAADALRRQDVDHLDGSRPALRRPGGDRRNRGGAELETRRNSRDHLLRSFPGLPRDLPADRVKFWMGHRPSMPDGLPCIGPAPPRPIWCMPSAMAMSGWWRRRALRAWWRNCWMGGRWRSIHGALYRPPLPLISRSHCRQRGGMLPGSVPRIPVGSRDTRYGLISKCLPITTCRAAPGPSRPR